jgi:tRNA (guanosine-2'-O-)-methyltransferase
LFRKSRISEPATTESGSGEEAREREIARLEPLLTPQRLARLRAVLGERSDHVAFVFEEMTDPHNLSAALRSLDAFAFQDAHLIRPGERLALSSGITIGSERWLTLHEAPDAAACLAGLKRAGYRIYASQLSGEDALPLSGIDFSCRTALAFGNEHAGVGRDVLALADDRFRVEMHGFVDSLNLSVAVAVCAFHARQALQRLRLTDPRPERFGLGEERRRALYVAWLRQSVRRAGEILAHEGADAKD